MFRNDSKMTGIHDFSTSFKNISAGYDLFTVTVNSHNVITYFFLSQFANRLMQQKCEI